ncbi:hypothetical protein HanIR_Chr07g0312051 [Helianthus annuus]|nr:hypothetical protein HanIR_Chr07g0312051 [Helianthus annuus]
MAINGRPSPPIRIFGRPTPMTGPINSSHLLHTFLTLVAIADKSMWVLLIYLFFI